MKIRGFTFVDFVLGAAIFLICAACLWAIVSSSYESCKLIRDRRTSFHDIDAAVEIFERNMEGVLSQSNIVSLNDKKIEFMLDGMKTQTIEIKGSELVIDGKRAVSNLMPESEILAYDYYGRRTYDTSYVARIELNLVAEIDNYGRIQGFGSIWLRNVRYYDGFAEK